MSLALVAGSSALVAMIAAMVVARLRGSRDARDRVEAARAEAKVAVKSADREAAAVRRAAETAARAATLEQRAALEQQLTDVQAAMQVRQQDLARRERELADLNDASAERRAMVDEGYARIRSLEDRARGLHQDVDQKTDARLYALEQRAGLVAAEVAEGLATSWLEQARAEAAHMLRTVEQSGADPDYGRRAKRYMDIAFGRYRGHFLTERAISNVPVADGIVEILSADGGRLLEAIQIGANVQLHPSDSGQSIKLDGLDGVGREVARRVLARLSKKPEAIDKAKRDPAAWVGSIRTQLDQEIQGLGKKAFSVLEIPRAHPEIVTLVGRLNYRTSYTQNQWLHAVEAAFLAGMIAEEMDLDIKLVRRATLMHDIGKALTHEIEGSHAVIGADIARRLGETEIVANAIGSHHADEPPNSVYAYLVAACDAMSGARPGARREHPEGYSTKLQDLERIGANYHGVDRCFAVHGGRELRVYVREDQVTDLRAFEMSSEIAAKVSEEMTFPGQIKVTVIRTTEAVAVAS